MPFRSNPILSAALAQTLADNPSLREITYEIIGIQLKLGMPPEAIYAFIKTGCVLTPQNAGTFSLTEMEDWQNVQMEYFVHAAHQTAPSTNSCRDRLLT